MACLTISASFKRSTLSQKDLPAKKGDIYSLPLSVLPKSACYLDSSGLVKRASIHLIVWITIEIKRRLIKGDWPSQLRPCRPSLSSLQSRLILHASYISSFSFSSSFSPAKRRNIRRASDHISWRKQHKLCLHFTEALEWTNRLVVIYTGQWRLAAFPALCWSLRLRSRGRGWRIRRWALGCKDIKKM